MLAGDLAGADALFLLVGVAGLLLVPMGLPGLWLIVAAAVTHHVVTRTGELGLPFLIVAGVLAAAAEVAETLLGVLTARRYGATRRGMWGAFLGGLIGGIALSPLFPIVGTLVGAFAGAFAGAFLGEWSASRRLHAGWRAGLGAFVGRAAAVAVKTAVGLVILVTAFLRLA